MNAGSSLTLERVGRHVHTDHEVAIQLEHCDVGLSLLAPEIDMYKVFTRAYRLSPRLLAWIQSEKALISSFDGTHEHNRGVGFSVSRRVHTCPPAKLRHS